MDPKSGLVVIFDHDYFVFMQILTLQKAATTLRGTIDLTGSKSIANRALLIRALSRREFPILRLANAKDTQLLNTLLSSSEEVLDAGAAGTTYRFLTAYLSLQSGTQILTGTDRMKQRPIGVLAEALKKLGARIEYLEKEGYPPLRIGPADQMGETNELAIAANTSSQYISALLMIAPTLPNGLILKLEGTIVSRPYIEMTLKLMAYFGVEHVWEDQTIRISHQSYMPRAFTVEADWSAASYYYAMAALTEDPDIHLHGLFPDSVQGDSVLADMMEHFGIQTEYHEKGVHLTRSSPPASHPFRFDFLRCPDLAQTLAVVCAGLGLRGEFAGLETLRIKETDRIAALQQELAKVGCAMEPMSYDLDDKEWFAVTGKAKLTDNSPAFATYEDHRMAMAFAPLALLGPIRIEEPEVVVKSYPAFWEDLSSLGFQVERGWARG